MWPKGSSAFIENIPVKTTFQCICCSTQCSNDCRRRNLGYLWAIQHGATHIYETDGESKVRTNGLLNLSHMKYYVYNVSGEKLLRPLANGAYMRMAIVKHTFCTKVCLSMVEEGKVS